MQEKIRFFGSMPFGKAPGKCIYCGRLKGLSDEHVVAYCLAMDAYVPAASCRECAKITSYIEGYAGRHIFGPLRKHFNIQSRRKHIELGNVDIVFTTSDGTKASRAIPRDKLPALVALPILAPAGLFHDQSPAPITSFTPWLWQAEDPTPFIRPYFQDREIHAKLRLNINPLVFARLLAKIAHAASVGWIDLESFKPFLPPLILGKDDRAAYLVGGASPPTAPGPAQPYRNDTLHHVLKLVPMSSPGQPTILVAEIRLFIHIGSPSYYVIVGELLPSGLERLTVKGVAPML